MDAANGYIHQEKMIFQPLTGRNAIIITPVTKVIYIYIYTYYIMYHYKPIITVKGRQKHVSLGVPCDTTFGSKFLIP